MGMLSGKKTVVSPIAGLSPSDSLSEPPPSTPTPTPKTTTLKPHGPVHFDNPTVALAPLYTLSPSPPHPSTKNASEAIVVTLSMPDLTLFAKTITGKFLASAKPFGQYGSLLGSRNSTTFGVYTRLKGKEIKKTLAASLKGLVNVVGDNLVIFSGDCMTVGGQLLLTSIVPMYSRLVMADARSSKVENIMCYLALPSPASPTIIMKGTTLDVYATLIGVEMTTRALLNTTPYVFTNQELYYADSLSTDRVKVLENVINDVMYWRASEEIGKNQPVKACCVCSAHDMDYFKAKFDAAWEMRGYTSCCKDVLEYTEKNVMQLYSALMSSANLIDKATEIFSPVGEILSSPLTTILTLNVEFDPNVEVDNKTNQEFLMITEKDKLIPAIDHSLDSCWTTCVVIGIGGKGKEASNMLQKKNEKDERLIFAPNFETGSKELTNNKKSQGKGWVLLLCDSSWSTALTKTVIADYKSVKDKYTLKEEFMVVCLCVTPPPNEQSSHEECVGAARFLNFAMEHIKLNVFSDSFEEALEFSNFMLKEGNQDVFCPFSLYNFLSPYSDRLSLVQLVHGKGKHLSLIDAYTTEEASNTNRYANANNPTMLAYSMTVGISVEQGLKVDGFLDPSARTWVPAMADRYGRQREDAKDENAIPYYFTLASSMKELEFLYVIKNKCEESFCCSGEGGKIDKKNVDAEDYKCWMSVMAYTLWTNIMV